VRLNAGEALGAAFEQAPDKTQAWQDLVNLSQDKNRFMRLLRISQDEDIELRKQVADALATAFLQVLTKDKYG